MVSQMGISWKDESGVIWGGTIRTPGGPLPGSWTSSFVVPHEDAEAYYASLSDANHKYSLPTYEQMKRLLKYLGEGSEAGFIPEIISDVTPDGDVEITTWLGTAIDGAHLIPDELFTWDKIYEDSAGFYGYDFFHQRFEGHLKEKSWADMAFRCVTK